MEELYQYFNNNPNEMLIQILFLYTGVLAILGSRAFVEHKFEHGARLFITTNFVTILLGVYIGNLYFSLAQAGLMFFTLKMLSFKNNELFYGLNVLSTLFIIFILDTPDLSNLAFKPHGWIDVVASVTAWYGAYKMSKGQQLEMAFAWIVADLGFLWIAYQHKLLGLAIMATFFIYHGCIRLYQTKTGIRSPVKDIIDISTKDA